MSIKPSPKVTIAVIITVLLLGILLAVTNTPMAQTSPQIPVYKVVGPADLSNSGSASYWSKIPWINISLTANIPQAPTSGLTHYIYW